MSGISFLQSISSTPGSPLESLFLIKTGKLFDKLVCHVLILILTKQSSYLLGRGKMVNHYNQFGVVISSNVLRPPRACSLEVEFFTNNWPLDSLEAS